MDIRVYRHKVQYYETDKMGIVHHSNYIRWMEEARIDLLFQLGWPYDRLEAMGIVSPVVSVSCRYLLPAAFPEEITVSCRVTEFRGVVLKLAYEMKNPSGATVFKGTSEHCFLSSDGRMLRIKTSYPELYETLARAVSPEEST